MNIEILKKLTFFHKSVCNVDFRGFTNGAECIIMILLLQLLKEEQGMWMVLAQIIGLAAVALYLLSFQLKKRGQILFATCLSYIFYVLQYLMLGAYAGAVMDVLSAGSSLLASQKNKEKFQRYAKVAAVGSCLAIAVAGLIIAILRKDPAELLPIGGALLQAGGLWFNKEQTIRWFGLAGAPFWLAYNFVSQAYGAALGAALTIVSTVVALMRYRRKDA